MTDKEQIKRISKLLNELSLDDITSTEFDEMFPKQSINDIKDELWRMYCFVSDVCDTINMGDTWEQEPKTGWIPVSERLPEDRDWYLGIFKESDTGWINPLPFVCDYVGHETKATTKELWILRGFTDRDEHIDYYFNLECVAWMPLPEPYKESEE